MKDRIKPKTLPGFMELLPKEQILFNKMKDIIQKSYEEYGFLPLDTPVIEDASVLLAKAGGETEKQIYRFSKSDNDLALRFDLTVPLAKYVTEYYDKLNFPFRRYQIGKVYRGEKPQKGRYREFYQCDIDIVGDGKLSIINDAEMPAIIYNTFTKLGFDDITICINNRKILNGLFLSLGLQNDVTNILRIIDKIDKIGKDEVKKELLDDINEEKVNVIVKFLEIKGSNKEKIESLEKLNINEELFVEGVNELKEILGYIQKFEVPEKYINVDLTIARGLDYYTGTVYETFLNKNRNFGSVCSGGRYDNLTSCYLDKQMPGVGVSIGLTRLFFLLMDNNIISANNEFISNTMVISMADDYDKCIEVASILRNSGIKVQVNTESQKVAKKFKYANNLNVKYLIIIGENEIKSNVLSLKNMITGEQETVSIEKAIEIIKCDE